MGVERVAPPGVRVPLAILLVVALVAGCTKPETPSTTTTPTTPTGVVVPPAGTDPATRLALVEVDGHWGFPLAAARALVGDPGAGGLWSGESRIAKSGADTAVAGNVVAFDTNAAALLGGAPAPAAGDVWLSKSATDRLGAAVGDELQFTSYAWPRSSVIMALEMERVRACEPSSPSTLCIKPSRGNGTPVELALQVPPGSSDLMFNPDVVELSPRDFPAKWNGSFVAPSGRVTPFETSARTRADADPPGGIRGPVEPGSYTIRFTIEINGTIAPNAVAGLVTFRAPGYTSFSPDLLRVPDAARQTRLALQNGTRHDATLRVAGTFAPSNATTLTHAIAVISPADASALFDVGAGNATALVAHTRAGIASAVLTAAAAQEDPSLRQLRVRSAAVLPAPTASATLRWAPPDVATSAEAALPLGAALIVGRGASDAGTRVLALPTTTPLPWSLVPKALWPNESAAFDGIGRGPHLLLVSDDLARDEGLDPTNLTYTQISLDGSTGPRTAFVMGAVHGAPPRTVWASAAFMTASSRIAGARWIGPLADAPAGTAELLAD